MYIVCSLEMDQGKGSCRKLRFDLKILWLMQVSEANKMMPIKFIIIVKAALLRIVRTNMKT